MNRRKFILTSSALITIPFLNIVGCKSSSSKKINQSSVTDPKIEKLNLAIEHEYGAILQYCNHAAITNNTSFKKIISPIIYQEVQHAITISNIIKELGYSPTLSLWPPQSGNSFAKIIKEDIEAEKNAIELYEEILKLKLNNRIKRKIAKIIKHEESHLKIFKNIKL